MSALAYTLCAALALAAFWGCQQDRPRAEDWAQNWAMVRRGLPDRDALLASANPRPMCERALGDVREQARGLFPAPDDVIEAAARSWLSAAEQIYYDCPPEGGFDAAFARLHEIEREIQAALEQ